MEGDILFLSLPCITVPRTAVTPEIMATMLAADNGISTSSFQLYDAGSGKVTVTLNNFCKLQDMGPDDEDDILSCVHFLLVDVMTARRLLSGLAAKRLRGERGETIWHSFQIFSGAWAAWLAARPTRAWAPLKTRPSKPP